MSKEWTRKAARSQYPEAWKYFTKNVSSDPDQFFSSYQGKFDSPPDYVRQYIIEEYEIKEKAILQFIDFEGIASHMDNSRDAYFLESDDGKVHVFLR